MLCCGGLHGPGTWGREWLVHPKFHQLHLHLQSFCFQVLSKLGLIWFAVPFLQSFAWATILPALLDNTVTSACAQNLLHIELFVFVCEILWTHKLMACHTAGYQKMILATLSWVLYSTFCLLLLNSKWFVLVHWLFIWDIPGLLQKVVLGWVFI
jgi:hypothetical protein